jgi:anti-sigma regulatory factor (Ser/Thr protein kinase)
VRATDIQTRTERSVTRNGLDAVHFGAGRRPSTGREARMSVTLEPGASAAGEARAALAALHGRVDPGVLDDIRLLVSELVTNSVRHAGADRDLVHLDVRTGGREGAVRVEVSDAGRGFKPSARDTDDLDTPGGWGLHLVEQLADRWGVETGRRTRVWFELRPAAA